MDLKTLRAQLRGVAPASRSELEAPAMKHPQLPFLTPRQAFILRLMADCKFDINNYAEQRILVEATLKALIAAGLASCLPAEASFDVTYDERYLITDRGLEVLTAHESR